MESSSGRNPQSPVAPVSDVSIPFHRMSLKDWSDVIAFKIFHLPPEAPAYVRRLFPLGFGLAVTGIINECINQTSPYMPIGASVALGIAGGILESGVIILGIGGAVKISYGVGPRLRKQVNILGELEEKYLNFESRVMALESELRAQDSGEERERDDVDNLHMAVSVHSKIDTESCPATFCQQGKNFFKEYFWFTPGISLDQKVQEGVGPVSNSLIGYVGFSHLPKFLGNTQALIAISYVTGAAGGFVSFLTTKSVLSTTFCYQASPDTSEMLEKRIEGLTEKCEQLAQRIFLLKGQPELESKEELSEVKLISDVVESNSCTRKIIKSLESCGKRALMEIKHHVYQDSPWTVKLALGSSTLLASCLSYAVINNFVASLSNSAPAGIVVGAISGVATLVYTNTVCSFNAKYAKTAQVKGSKIAQLNSTIEAMEKEIQELEREILFIEVEPSSPDLMVTSTTPAAGVTTSQAEEKNDFRRASRCPNICEWGIFSGFTRQAATLKRMVTRQTEPSPANDLQLAFVSPATTRAPGKP